MDKRVYILMKDLPFVKSGVEYIKADGFNGVHDNTSYVPNKMGMMHERFAIHSDYVEGDDGTWFKLKEDEKIVVVIDRVNDSEFEKHWHDFYTNKAIPEEKIDLVKKAIEDCLNSKCSVCGADVKIGASLCGDHWKHYEPKLYTQKQLLEAEEKAFNAAREHNFQSPPRWVKLGEFSSSWDSRQYPNFSDYKNNKIANVYK